MINWNLSVSRDKQDTELLIPCYVYKARAISVQYIGKNCFYVFILFELE